MADRQDSGRRSLAAYFKTLFSRTGQGDDIKGRVREAIDDHSGTGTPSDFSTEEREMLLNILKYGELRVDDVMVPRVDIVGADVDTGLEALVKLMGSAAHSRLPVFRGSLDDILGLVHVKDLLRVLSGSSDLEAFKLETVMRPVLFVPPSMRVMDLLAKMRRRRMHLAIVVDEYGGTDGLVTIEDLVEQIVGDIEDEHDVDADPDIKKIAGGCYDADARLPIDVLEDTLEISLLDDAHEDEVDTIGGLVFTLAGEVPEIGDVIAHDSGVQFEVVDADPRRISKIRVHPAPDPDPKPDAG